MFVSKLFYVVYYCFEANKLQSIFDIFSKPIVLVFSHKLCDKKDGILVKKNEKYHNIAINVCFKAVLYGLPLF